MRFREKMRSSWLTHIILRGMTLIRRAALLVAVALTFLPIRPAVARPGGFVPPPVAREFRAMWLTPIADGGPADWPSRPGLSVDEQKAELRNLLDWAQRAGLNAVIMHVRL